eukprot:4662343-Pyramimonas_sp.AAC.4
MITALVNRGVNHCLRFINCPFKAARLPCARKSAKQTVSEPRQLFSGRRGSNIDGTMALARDLMLPLTLAYVCITSLDLRSRTCTELC